MARRTSPLAPPPMPEQTPAQRAASEALSIRLRALADDIRARNLSVAVLLAQQAACGHGPLVDHFAQLRRDWSHLLKPVKAARTALRVIEGGAD